MIYNQLKWFIIRWSANFDDENFKLRGIAFDVSSAIYIYIYMRIAIYKGQQTDDERWRYDTFL